MNMQQLAQTVERLQELEITAQELRIMAPLLNPANLPIVEKNIAELLESLPPEIRSRYERLRKNGLASNRVLNGTCQNCRMTLTQPLMNRMKNNETEWICPNCGHFITIVEQPKI